MAQGEQVRTMWLKIPGAFPSILLPKVCNLAISAIGLTPRHLLSPIRAAVPAAKENA